MKIHFISSPVVDEDGSWQLSGVHDVSGSYQSGYGPEAVRVKLYLLRETRKSDEQWCEDPHMSRSQTKSRWSRIRIDVKANRGLDNICPRQVNLSEDAVRS